MIFSFSLLKNISRHRLSLFKLSSALQILQMITTRSQVRLCVKLDFCISKKFNILRSGNKKSKNTAR